MLKNGMILSDHRASCGPKIEEDDASLRLALGGALPNRALDFESVASSGPSSSCAVTRAFSRRATSSPRCRRRPTSSSWQSGAFAADCAAEAGRPPQGGRRLDSRFPLRRPRANQPRRALAAGRATARHRAPVRRANRSSARTRGAPRRRPERPEVFADALSLPPGPVGP